MYSKEDKIIDGGSGNKVDGSEGNTCTNTNACATLHPSKLLNTPFICIICTTKNVKLHFPDKHGKHLHFLERWRPKQRNWFLRPPPESTRPTLNIPAKVIAIFKDHARLRKGAMEQSIVFAYVTYIPQYIYIPYLIFVHLANVLKKETKPTIPSTVTLTEGKFDLGGTVFIPSETEVSL